MKNQNKPIFRPSKITIALLTGLGIFVTGSAYAQDKEEAEEKTDAIEIIEVKGMRSSIVSAQETKMNANKIMDGISADNRNKYKIHFPKAIFLDYAIYALITTSAK